MGDGAQAGWGTRHAYSQEGMVFVVEKVPTSQLTL